MSAVANPAQGTVISYSTDAGSTYTALGEVLSINHGGGGEVGERETTVLTSTAKTFAPTIPDNGEVTLSLNWDPASTEHQQLRTWKDTPAATTPMWKIAWATAVAHTTVFTAWVKSLDGPNADDVDSNLSMDVTLRVTGAPTYT